MPRSNDDVAAAFEREAKLLAIQQANPFRVRAYRNAADTIRRLGRPLHEMVAAGMDLSELPAIGKDLARQIEEILETGTSKKLSETEHRVAPSLIELLDIPGLGPARVNTLHEHLGIETRSELDQALRAGKISELPGFGKGMEQRLLAELGLAAGKGERMLLSEARALVEPLVRYLEGCPGVQSVVVCGSYRRRKPTVGDLDVTIVTTKPAQTLRSAGRYKAIVTRSMEGETRSTFRLEGGAQVDLRAVRPIESGAAICYFTGNKAHNIQLRRRAQSYGFKLNEYGLFAGEKRMAGRDEKSIYRALGLAMIPPELRHGTDEIEKAEANALPELIEPGDITGDLHLLLPDSRSKQAIFVRELRRLGHSFAGFVRPWHSYGQDLESQAAASLNAFSALARTAANAKRFRIFKGLQVKLPATGDVRVPARLLDSIDYLIVAIEDDLTLSRTRQSTRIVTAMRHPKVRIIAHPLCRDLRRHAGISLDLGRIYRESVSHGCALEIHGDPRRLDLPAVHCRAAIDAGVTLCPGSGAATAATAAERLDLAVSVARRGWVGPENTLNCQPASAIARWLARHTE